MAIMQGKKNGNSIGKKEAKLYLADEMILYVENL